MAEHSTERSAVVDIGSNTVRMVVYDDTDRSLEPVFNEKAMSGLGRGLLETGRLNPAGRASALAVLARFRLVADALGAHSLRAVATAAARTAADGSEFIAAASAALGREIDVIPGKEEARLSALGVICGIPDADGIVADLGGGSLEIADVADGRVGETLSLQLGPLSVGLSRNARQEARFVAQGLEAAPGRGASGRTLYAVGGAWRALAKHYFDRNDYPIRIIHEFALPAAEAMAFARTVGRTRTDGLDRLKGISARRRADAPYAARLLRALTERLAPRQVVFSGYGLREGVQFEQMPAALRALDPLLEHCRRVGLGGARQPFDGDRLAEWAAGAFDAPPASPRLLRAAAWLSDLSGYDHPDYRGHHAAARAMHLASAAIDHRERVFLAATVYARYHGYGMESALGTAVELIDQPTRDRAVALGMAFRLAHAIEPGGDIRPDTGLRSRFSLERAADRLYLVANAVDPDVLGETALKRFAALARALGVEGEVVRRQSAAA